jgi:hypothetical protein
VVGVYRDNEQPYATDVEATDPHNAIAVAQQTCRVDNGFGDDAPDPLFGVQVIDSDGNFVV